MPIDLSIWVYGRLLYLCPRDFHDRFADEMLEVFEDVLRDEAHHRGYLGLAVLSCSAYCELLQVATLLRLRDAPVTAAGLALAASSALFLGFFRAVS
jgi:hypothetical protein